MSPKLKQSLVFYSYAVLAFAGYIAFFLAFYSVLGESVAIFAFVPPLIIAWLNGIRRGIIAAIAADINILALLQFEGVKSWDATSLKQRLPGLIAVIIIPVIVGYMRELRERVKKELEQKKKAQEQLKQKNMEVLNFTNMMAHDLRKPLTAIKTAFSLLSDAGFRHESHDADEMARTGLDASDYTNEMLIDLLELARAEAGVYQPSIETVNAGEVVREVLQRLRLPIGDKKIEIVTDADIDVLADRKALSHIFSNLIGNAVAYIGTPSSPRIAVRALRENGLTRFEISDNGMGIPEKDRPFVFDKFRRGGNVTSISGTGFGLAIVKTLIEAHQGKIRFDSREGAGTTFYFTMPNASAGAPTGTSAPRSSS